MALHDRSRDPTLSCTARHRCRPPQPGPPGRLQFLRTVRFDCSSVLLYLGLPPGPCASVSPLVSSLCSSLWIMPIEIILHENGKYHFERYPLRVHRREERRHPFQRIHECRFHRELELEFSLDDDTLGGYRAACSGICPQEVYIFSTPGPLDVFNDGDRIFTSKPIAVLNERDRVFPPGFLAVLTGSGRILTPTTLALDHPVIFI